MNILGRCHCGNLSYEFQAPGEPTELAVRACGCTFCVKHGGVWTSHPQGKLTASIGGEVSIYRFGTQTGDFYVCARCGAVPFVTSEIDGRLWNRLARRKQRWIPKVDIGGL